MLLDLAREAGLDPQKKSATNGGEYCSTCPKCGGTDRFLIWPNQKSSKCEGTYWCRGCNARGDSVQFCKDFLGMSYAEAFKRCGINGQQQTGSYFPTTQLNLTEKYYLANWKWKKRITALSQSASGAILQNKLIMDKLANRGLPEDAVKYYKLGYLSMNTSYKNEDLGLPLSKDKKNSVWIPRGITIPTFEKDQVIRMKVRRDAWRPNDTLPKYIAVSGSLKGMNLIGDRSKDAIIVVESELDAYAVHWLVQDKALVIAVGSNLKHPDGLTHDLVKNCSRLFVIHDNDEGGRAMLEKWKGLYPKALGYSPLMGKDIGEAFEIGFNVNEWLQGLIS